MIQVRYFASLRERLGLAEEELKSEGLSSLSDVRARLADRPAPWSEAFGTDQRLMASVNQTLASPETRIADGDEVAFFPPVTGG